MTPLACSVHPLAPAQVIAPNSFGSLEEANPFLTGPQIPISWLLHATLPSSPAAAPYTLPDSRLLHLLWRILSGQKWDTCILVSKGYLHGLSSPQSRICLSPSTAPPQATTRLPQGPVHTGTAAVAGGKMLHPGSPRRQHSPVSCRGHPSQYCGEYSGTILGPSKGQGSGFWMHSPWKLLRSPASPST